MANEDMDVERLCALTEDTAVLKPDQFATREEVRALAREVVRLRFALRAVRLQAQHTVTEVEQALVDAPIAGGEYSL